LTNSDMDNTDTDGILSYTSSFDKEKNKEEILAKLKKKIKLRKLNDLNKEISEEDQTTKTPEAKSKKHDQEIARTVSYEETYLGEAQLNSTRNEETGKRRKRRRHNSAEKQEQESVDESTETSNEVKEKSKSQVQSEGENVRVRKKRRKIRRKKLINGDSASGQSQQQIGGFTVIGEVSTSQGQVSRVLPTWISKPTFITNELHGELTPLSDMDNLLSERLVKRLDKDGITHFFPVQQQVIPVLLEHANNKILRPSDVCVCAPTGSGKTLTFVLPILQALHSCKTNHVRALVVVPTKNLAFQVRQVFKKFRSGWKVQIALLNGESRCIEEAATLVKTVDNKTVVIADIVVATPGRLVEHLHKTKGFSLAGLQYLVIDEADRVVSEFQHDWLTEVERSIYSGQGSPSSTQVLTVSNMERLKHSPQKLLFSATLSRKVETLQALNLFHPRLFTSLVEPSPSWVTRTDVKKRRQIMKKFPVPETLKQLYTTCGAAMKPLILLHLLLKEGYKKILCFTEALSTAHRLNVLMKELYGSRVRQCSANMSNQARTNVLSMFQKDEIDILLCTDAVARGIDLDNVECVVLYDPPFIFNNYVHRIGRTARAGRPGTAITLVQSKQMKRFMNTMWSGGIDSIEQKSVTQHDLSQYEDRYQQALAKLKTVTQEEHEARVDKVPGRRRQRRNPEREKARRALKSKSARRGGKKGR